jgi:DNA-binding Lrp family transcriptional regulator
MGSKKRFDCGIGGNGLKDVELRLISELMKNSRRSDRELAKIIGVSQPTVSRMVKRLVEQGYIREFTIVPDFKKIGFQMMTIVLTKMKKDIGPDNVEEARRKVREDEKRNPSPILLAKTGIGANSDRVMILLTEDYSTYHNYMNMLGQYPMIEVEEINTFIIDLNDESIFMPLSFSNLAAYLEKKQSDI